MTSIKMSDHFKLPLTSSRINGDHRFLVDARNLRIGCIDCPSDAARLTAAAINAYDDNQARIAELESAIKATNSLGKIDMEAVRACYALVATDGEKINLPPLSTA